MYTPICAEAGVLSAIPSSTPHIQFNLILVSPVCLVLCCAIVLVSCLNSRQNPSPEPIRHGLLSAAKSVIQSFTSSRRTATFPALFLAHTRLRASLHCEFQNPNQRKLSGAASQIYETDHHPLGLKSEVNGLPYTSE